MNLFKNLSSKLKKSLIGLVMLTQILSIGVVNLSPIALAEESDTSTSEAAASSATCPKVTGTTAPTGSAAHTYSFNPASCLWENAYYTWDPVTKAYTALYDQTPVYNATTNTWDHIQWDYSPAAGAYISSTISVPAAPLLAASSPATAAATAGGPAGSQSQTAGSATVSNTGAGSNNQISNNTNTDADLTIINNASILTALNSTALSGNALVLGNTNGGNATSGDATAIGNVLNMLQSSWDPVGGDFNTFVANLYGSYTGDLLFDPSQIMTTGNNSNNIIEDNSNTDLTVNVQNNGQIVNNLNLNAQTGDATVSGNTNGGNATSGDALAVANLINMINSSISSDQGFVGSINLFGQLDGDILLPSSLQDLLMDTGANSNNQIADNSTTNIDVDETNNYSITNNTNLTASSGTAVVQGNTNGGDATTGIASTNLNEANLINQNVNSTKGLLVLVNVMGQWQGMILRVPTSSGIVGTGANSDNQINDNSVTNADVNVANNYSITNNLNLNAASGDATVTGNTNGGDATTGDANSTVNSLNMINSNLKFSEWFGVLFINVFGSWNGSFGVNTAAGGTGGKGAGSVQGSNTPPKTNVAAATTTTSAMANNSAGYFGYSTATNFATTNASSSPSATSSTATTMASTATTTQDNSVDNKKGRSNWVVIGAVILAIFFLVGERILGFIAGLLKIRR